MSEPVRLRSNEYWGRRSGTVFRDGSNAFIQGQFGVGSSSSGDQRRRFYWPMRRKDMGTGNLKGLRPK